jgi:hypothetical protein
VYGNLYKKQIVARTRQLTTNQFTVTVDINSKKNTNGIVRIFLGPKLDNKQQLNANRHNFVEIDQFIVKLNQGNNQINRQSCNFKNVVGNQASMKTIYNMALNTINQGKNGNNGNNNNNGNHGYTLNNLNIDTNNNNNGFPHRLVLPKGTVGGEEYTIFVVVNGVNNVNMNDNKFNYKDDLNFNNINTNNNNNNGNSNSDSNSDSNESGMNNNNNNNQFNNNNNNNNNQFNNNNNNNQFNNNDQFNNNNNNQYNNNNSDNDSNSSENNNMNTYQNVMTGKGNFNNENGVLIHNTNKCNKNLGNGNGILDVRSMGFPLDRQILDVNGFITNNMFFKNVKVYHIDNSKNGNMNNNNNNNNNY